MEAGEEAIYSLISMKEYVEGVTRPFGLGSSSATEPESALPPLLELDDDNWLDNVHDIDDDKLQKPPAKKIKLIKLLLEIICIC